MDLRRALDERIAEIADGDHKVGLQSVSRHIEAAIRHHDRGRRERDDTYFADAIYRCNQAFEGSIKEAYRVLAQQNPEKKSTAQIESFLSSGELLRERVLAQLKNYRQQWRNPSTHDYTLDFDEDEALLAIVSVSAFAIVLCDQILERLTFIATQQSDVGADLASADTPLLQQVAVSAQAFARRKRSLVPGSNSEKMAHAYRTIEAELAGYLSSALPHASVALHARLDASTPREVDVALVAGAERVAIELKMMAHRRNLINRIDDGTMQALKLLRMPQLSGAVLLVLSLEGDEYSIRDSEFAEGRLKIVAPAPKQLHT